MKYIFFFLVPLFVLSSTFDIIKKEANCYRNQETIDTKKEYNELLDAVYKYGKIYHFKPSLLIAICDQESDFRYALKHRRVRTSVYYKGRFRRRWTRAIGLGGIIYNSNPFVLKKAGIKYSDLYTIDGGVHAIAVVLRKKTNQCNGDIKCALRRYFGAGTRYTREVLKKNEIYKKSLIFDAMRKKRMKVKKRKTKYFDAYIFGKDELPDSVRNKMQKHTVFSELNTNCTKCGQMLNDHYEINREKYREVVCPGNIIVVDGNKDYVLQEDIFNDIYEIVKE